MLGCQVDIFHVIIIIKQLLKELMYCLNPCVQAHHSVLDAPYPFQVVSGDLQHIKDSLQRCAPSSAALNKTSQDV